MKPHKHAELIKAWADGAEIEEYRQVVNEWCLEKNPTWAPWSEYRIKPAEKVVRWLWAYKDIGGVYVLTRFFTEAEADKAFGKAQHKKLEWSREEFDD